MEEKIGFIGLGNIGKPIADNISRGSFEMSVYDIAGTRERAPAGGVCLFIRHRSCRELNRLFSLFAEYFFDIRCCCRDL